MDIRGITDSEMEQILKRLFPNDLSVEEARDRLELEIELLAEELECDEPIISPVWIMMVLDVRAEKDVAKMAPEDRAIELAGIYSRKKRGV